MNWTFDEFWTIGPRGGGVIYFSYFFFLNEAYFCWFLQSYKLLL